MALGEIRFALQTNRSALLSVQSRGIGHGNPGLVARLAQGDDVDYAEKESWPSSMKLKPNPVLAANVRACCQDRDRRRHLAHQHLGHRPGRGHGGGAEQPGVGGSAAAGGTCCFDVRRTLSRHFRHLDLEQNEQLVKIFFQVSDHKWIPSYLCDVIAENNLLSSSIALFVVVNSFSPK